MFKQFWFLKLQIKFHINDKVCIGMCEIIFLINLDN